METHGNIGKQQKSSDCYFGSSLRCLGRQTKRRLGFRPERRDRQRTEPCLQFCTKPSCINEPIAVMRDCVVRPALRSQRKDGGVNTEINRWEMITPRRFISARARRGLRPDHPLHAEAHLGSRHRMGSEERRLAAAFHRSGCGLQCADLSGWLDDAALQQHVAHDIGRIPPVGAASIDTDMADDLVDLVARQADVQRVVEVEVELVVGKLRL